MDSYLEGPGGLDKYGPYGFSVKFLGLEVQSLGPDPPPPPPPNKNGSLCIVGVGGGGGHPKQIWILGFI